ncbi:chromosome segregation protein SMC [Hamiltosporidium tvaerminnensis]|uniref:Structural maintenance of chromosomes protein n=1 Tax=Hamiltosporidium tvaerminnensis TaxID=1176355 RepID=A0A4Q9LQV1_9MICR|nr:chromosome segregation protein SMC [Hamiltosporidium tvaerminnensis]
MKNSRLVLSGIKLENFKSYKGIHFIDNIDPHFTAIVGPNGSGKSNIIDCMLFVLGFRAKKMRHSNLTDLIYNDGSKCNSCSVELFFKKGNTSFSIKRELFVNKKSNYYFNNQEVNQKHIYEFMTKEGVDLNNNRFLILQGEIENISMMKPNGLLEYIEDIINDSCYVEKINKLENEISVGKEEFESKKTLYNFCEKEFFFINEKKMENDKIISLIVEMLKKKNENCFFMKEKLERNLQKNENERLEIKSKLNEINSKNYENKKILDQKEILLQNCRKELKKEENEYLSLKKEFNKIEKENIFYEEKKERLSKIICNLKSEINDFEIKNKLNDSENKIIKRELLENENEIKEFKESVDSLKNEIQKSEKNNYKKIKPLVCKMKELENYIFEMSKEKSILLEKKGYLENEINFFKDKRKINETEYRALLDERDTLMDLINNNDLIERELTGKESEILEVESDLKETYHELNKRIMKFEEIKIHEEKNKKQNRVFEKIKSVKGVIGRLGDCGSIDLKYEIAINAAGGGILNNIVVDTTSTAEKCIGIIKKNNLPRTTFIILDRIENIPELPQESVPYLVNLVKCEEKLKKCFYFALKNTLVCNNLEEANKISFGVQRKRTVTLDGKLIDKTGLMSKKGNLRGNFNVSSEKIQKYESEIKQLKEAVKSMENTKNELSNEFKLINSNKQKIETSSKRISEIEIKISKFQKEELEKSHTSEKNMTNQIKDISNNLEIIENKISEFKNQINEYNSNISDIQGIEVKLKKSQIEMLFDKIELLEKRNQELLLKENVDLTNIINEKRVFLFDKEKEFSNLQPVLNYEEFRIKIENKELTYKEKLNDCKIINDEYIKIKDKIGNDFHIEAELRNKSEDIFDEIKKTRKEIKVLENEKEKNIQEFKHYSKWIVEVESLRCEGNLGYEGKSLECEGENLRCEGDKYIKEENVKEENVKEENENISNTNSSVTKNSKNTIEIFNFDLKNISEIELSDLIKETSKKIKNIENKITTRNLDIKLLEEFEVKQAEFEKIKSEFTYFKEKMENIKNELNEIKNLRTEEFMNGLNEITKNLKEIYRIITFGGNAELELVDYLNPFTEGIILSIMPPKKSWKNIVNLSGGEKTLASLALIFALHCYKPSPFYIMDEIDAALDYRNVSVIANFIVEKTKNTQFLVISLRNDMFELANVFLGVYKNNNCSKSIVVNFKSLRC